MCNNITGIPLLHDTSNILASSVQLSCKKCALDLLKPNQTSFGFSGFMHSICKSETSFAKSSKLAREKMVSLLNLDPVQLFTLIAVGLKSITYLFRGKYIKFLWKDLTHAFEALATFNVAKIVVLLI